MVQRGLSLGLELHGDFGGAGALGRSGGPIGAGSIFDLRVVGGGDGGVLDAGPGHLFEPGGVLRVVGLGDPHQRLAIVFALVELGLQNSILGLGLGELGLPVHGGGQHNVEALLPLGLRALLPFSLGQPTNATAFRPPNLADELGQLGFEDGGETLKFVHRAG